MLVICILPMSVVQAMAPCESHRSSQDNVYRLTMIIVSYPILQTIPGTH